MNILPKKRWHVRTKDNIARVRRDEAKAAEEERLKEERKKLAEREARTDILRKKAKQRIGELGDFISLDSSTSVNTNSAEHVNFFKEVEDGTAEYKQGNKEHDKEKKEEQEQYEKKIGLLTYLGQDTNEALGKTSWYNVVPDRKPTKDKDEVNMKSKTALDPLNVMKKLLGPEIVPKLDKKNAVGLDPTFLQQLRQQSKNTDSKSKHKQKHPKKHKKKKRKHKGSSDESEDEEEAKAKRQKLEMLRLQRLKREEEERKKSEALLAKYRGETDVETPKESSSPVKQKYNSQFNPDLAKQNYSPPRRH